MSNGSEVKKSSQVKVAFASLVGTAIEWYDFFLYGTSAALVFNKLFFPSVDPTVGTLLALVTFAVGFVARPFGGIIFGHFGDRIGRKTMLYLTLLIMGIATACVGLIPTYNEIGIWAPILLVSMRILQGIGLGGEWGGAVLMAYEHAPANRRGFYGSWPQLGAPLGLVLGNVVFMIFVNMYPGDLYTSTWAWRMPFLFSFALVIVGLYIRMKIAESPQFEKIKEAKQEAKMPLIEAITKHPKNLLLAMGARFAENGLFYIYATFSLVYVTTVLKMPRMTILTAILVAAFIESFTIPLFGYLSDLWGRRPVYIGGAVFSGIWAFPLFFLLDMKSPEYMIVAIAVGMAIGHSAMYGPQAAFMSELFSTRVRYSGASLGYQLASIFAGGISPLIATYLLKQSGGNPSPIAWYMIVLALITVVSVFLAKESYKTGGEQ
jgi:MFS transporter, MHS family, shikimate and dehydroshikimate transport protein